MKTQKQRIFSILAILTMTIILTCIFAACDKVEEKQVPVYKGMTISRSFAKASAMPASDDNGNHYGHFKGDHNNRDDEVDQNKPFEDPNAPSIENKANSTLDVVGAAESIYYADKNQDIFITIKLSNPDSYEILSFTLNGKKYSNYMFEDGSDMENLVLKVNVGDVGGIVEYTIDAIKYVDGTDIKDVRMDGDRTVKAGVRASDQTYVNVTNEQKSMTSISFDAQVVDLYSLIEKSGGYAKAVLYDGANMLTKDIKVGEKTNIVFDNLTPNTVYQYGVVALYDDLSGNGAKLNTLYKKAVYTDTIVLFKDVQVGKEGIEWGFVWNESFANKQMSAISLWQNGAKIQDVDTGATSLDGLKSNNEYTLKATYKNLQNQDKTIAIEFVTCAKATPSVTISNLSSTQNTIECDVAYTDVDNVGSVTEIALYKQDSKVKSVPFATHVAFEGLESGKEYKVVVAYKYDLNDGKGEQTATYGDKYSTLVDSIVVDSLSLLNNNVVKLGEELNLRVYFTNSSEIELTGIYVNGQKATVVGGDRIESAIVKFVPTTSGLCTFAIDRVDYVINGIEVNQEIDSSVDVKYPIYKDINLTYTPVTMSKYENTGDGVYISFDNADGYTIYKVNESEDFVVVADGKIFTKSISISSIEYGYDNYGHTTQNCDFKVDSWNDIHNVTALKRIYTVEDFFAMTDGYYLLMNDLDLRSTQTKAQIKLTGIFDANGHTIRGLSNVVDTSKYEYFNLFQGGSIYDATFKELYVSVNHTSNGNSPYVRPLGGATLYNCTIKGDIVVSTNVSVGGLNSVDDSITYALNVTTGTTTSTQKHTAANTIAKNTHIVERDDVFYFDCEVGKAFLSYANRNTADYTVEDGTFFVRNYAFADSETLRSITMPESVNLAGDYVFKNCLIENATIPVCLSYELGNASRTSLVTVTMLKGNATEIEAYAFNGCNSLTRVTISKNTTSIGEGAFGSCGNLQYVLYDDTAMSWGQINIESNNDCLMSAKKLYNHDGKTRTYTFVTNSTQENFSMSGLYLDELPVVEKEGYEFCGWYDNQQFDGARITTPYYDDKNTVLYAKWEIIHYTIKYDFGDAMSVSKAQNNSLNPLSYTILDEIEFAEPQRKGYTFVSWDKNISKGTTGEIVVAAKWIVDEYSIEYVLNGWTNSERNKTTYTIEDRSITLYDAIHDGSLFCGWYLDEECKNYIATIDASTMRDYIVYAYIDDSATIGLSIENGRVKGYSGTLMDVVIPSYYKGYNVTSIGDSAFESCTGLTSITIPDSVTNIGESAFLGCSSLESITIPFVGAKAGVTSSDIYQYPFGYIFGTSSYTGSVATEQIYYGSSTSYITNTTYYIPSSLKSVTVTGGNILRGAFYNCTGLTSVTIGNSVTSIGEWAFSGCSGLTSITIPDSVTSIGDRAFESCELTSIIVVEGNSKYHSVGNCLIETATKTLILGCKTSAIPTDGSVTSIGYEAFRGCTGLTSITIPDSVTSIGDWAFTSCSGLTSVTIPDSVTSIGNSAFYDCYSLDTINFEGTKEQWNAITKGDGWNGNVSATQVICTDGTISL